MKSEEYFIDDRRIIPEYIKNMTEQEILQRIEYLEKAVEPPKNKNMEGQRQNKVERHPK